MSGPERIAWVEPRACSRTRERAVRDRRAAWSARAIVVGIVVAAAAAHRLLADPPEGRPPLPWWQIITFGLVLGLFLVAAAPLIHALTPSRVTVDADGIAQRRGNRRSVVPRSAIATAEVVDADHGRCLRVTGREGETLDFGLAKGVDGSALLALLRTE